MQITMTQPDDWHCHLRDDLYLSRTVTDISRYFARAIVMPNLCPPVTNLSQATAYQARILQHCAAGQSFEPLLTLYLNATVDAETIQRGHDEQLITAYKYYPAGATTHSQAGVTDIKTIYPMLELLQKLDIPLLLHGESTDPHIDVFARETHFIDHTLVTLRQHFPNLRMVLEHVSTEYAVDFVKKNSPYMAATITAHHLLYNRNAIFQGGLRPHFYCLPLLKTEQDRVALLKAATSGHEQFFLGTDSAPHAKEDKQSACGCAGIYTGYSALELYAEIFEQQNALKKLENFASLNGAKFYKRPVNKTKIVLKKQAWKIPLELPYGKSSIVPLKAGETLQWQVERKIYAE